MFSHPVLITDVVVMRIQKARAGAEMLCRIDVLRSNDLEWNYLARRRSKIEGWRCSRTSSGAFDGVCYVCHCMSIMEAMAATAV